MTEQAQAGPLQWTFEPGLVSARTGEMRDLSA
jgi:hypothetical protein